MSWWLIVLIILLALFLIGRIRIGARIRYDTRGLAVTVIAGPARLRVLPAKERPEKSEQEREKWKKKRAEKERRKAADRKEGKPGTLARLMDLLPVLAEAAGALRRKILIHSLDLKVVWGAPDAAGAAIGFGRAHVMIGMIWPFFDHNFRVRRHAFQVDVDYEAHHPEVAVGLELTMTIGQALAFVLRYSGKALIKWSRSGQRSQRRQEA